MFSFYIWRVADDLRHSNIGCTGIEINQTIRFAKRSTTHAYYTLRVLNTVPATYSDSTTEVCQKIQKVENSRLPGILENRTEFLTATRI